MSDLDKKYPLRLDTRINFKNLIPHFYISDNQTNDFYIKLTNDNKPVEVEDIIVVIAVINPNGNINSSFLDTKTEKGLIYCNLPNELKNVVGVYKARIMCISGEERIVSNTFEYKVDTDEFQLIDEITEDSEEMIVLSQMLSRLSNMEIESQANETERTAKETERIANEAERIENENLRQQAEDNRNTTEEARVVAESNRISNESERVLGEQTRVENEQNRISAENERISNENIRKENENRRLEKENDNIQAELNRVQAESNRVQAELKREQSESNRKNSENARNDNEDIRKQNELKRQSNENTRITNESTRIANEAVRVSNEDKRYATALANEKRINDLYNDTVSKTNKLVQDVNLSINNIIDDATTRTNELIEDTTTKTNKVIEDATTNVNELIEDINTSVESYAEAEAQRQANEDERIANENERAKVNADRQRAEQTRVTNERNRKEAETARASAERNRANNESVRISNENIRKNNEEKRKEEFKAKIIEIDNALASLGTADSVNWENVVGKPTFATVATSGSYNDLTDKPTIPEAGIPSLVGSNENIVKIWELEDGVYNLSGILKYRYDYYSTETGGTLEGWQIEGLYIIYNAGDDPGNEGRTIKICKNLKYNFYFKYSLLNGTIESSRYDPEYIEEGNSNPIGEEEAIIVLPNNLTASDYYYLPIGLYRVTTDFFFDATTNCELRNGLTNDMLTLPNGSLISCMGQGLIINLSYSMYLILNDTGEVYVVGSTNNAWTGELATVATTGSYNDLTDKPTIPHYNETLMFEISGETDYGNFYANRYFNISALSLDETKSYVGKHKPIMDFPDELIHEFVYNKEANALMDEINSVYIYNHKSYNGTNFIEDENSAVLTYDIKPMAMSSGYNGYFRLYEIEKLELNNNCLSDDVSIKNSLTVGSRIGDIGKYSVAEGNENTASGNCSHAEGISTIASGDYSHAEGDNTTANGVASHAEGVNTTASGDFSHAEGGNTIASTDFSHAEGYYTIASTDFQHVQGRFNIEDTGRIYAHIVGNGVSDTERRNAHTLDWNGNAWYQGKLSQDGTPAEDKDLATKKYVDDSIATVNADTIDNLHIWTGTQSQYDALGTKDSNTIYLIKEG